MHAYIAELVATILVSQPRLHLPINPKKLKHKRKIVIHSTNDFFLKTPARKQDFTEYSALQDGMTIVTEKHGKPLYLVLYNDEVKNPFRISFTIAHELGHIYLEHKRDNQEQEKEADIFAAELLAPRCMLWELSNRYDTIPPELVQEVFGVSASMAKKRLVHRYPEPVNIAERKLLERAAPLLPYPEQPHISLSLD